jgi:hypothetical protein
VSRQTNPLPSGALALAEPFAAFPSWFIPRHLRTGAGRSGCSTSGLPTAGHADPRRPRPERHDGCGGRAGKAELVSGIEGVNSRPVRKIALRDG